jgi:ATPase family associated with various cellular activities (AAA)
MSDAATWQEENTRALSAAIAWVRALLQRHAESDEPLEVDTERDKPTERSPWFRRRRKPQAHFESGPAGTRLITGGTGQPPLLAPADQPSPTAAIPPPALFTLRDRLGLTPFELNILLLCAAMELDTSIAALCARVQREPERAYPTFALALSLFDEPAWEALSPERPLRYWHLIEISQPGGQPLTTSRLRADEWIVNYLKGLSYLDDRLTPHLMPIAAPAADIELSPSQARVADQIVGHLRTAKQGETPPAIQLLGPDAPSKRLVAGVVCRESHAHPYRLQLSALPGTPADLETFARLWRRAAMLLPVALYLETDAADQGERTTHVATVSRFLSRANALVFVEAREPWPGLPERSFSVDVAKPTTAEQKAAWEAALGPDAGESPALLAGQFSLNLGTIREIAAETRVAAPSGATDHDRLWDACLARSRPSLEALAERIVPKATWDDIVLPPAEKALLRQVADQVAQRNRVYQDWGFEQKMSRGFGVSALFAGESGTGKTMAAEVVANHLRLDLYRIDLSAVVSKYIGETEKNLRRLFDAAEAGGMILFFDEADALFGKRSEVKDSHDRYANIEVNYLLQRMESFGGLAILASNMKSALDGAFLRRLRFVVNFPFPGTVERKAIWERAFPPQTPSRDLDFDRLARLNLAGGHIALITLNAAFVAAQAKSEVTMPLILEAARNEFRKIERPIHEPDFRWPPTPVRVA